MTRFAVAVRVAFPVLLAMSSLAVAGPARAQQVLTHAEGVTAGAQFDKNNETLAFCPTSITGGPSGTSVVVTVDCRHLPLGTTVTFDLFSLITLNAPWRVSGFTSSTGQVLTAPSGSNPFTRIRLPTEPNSRRSSTITLTVAPTVPAPLPNCLPAMTQTPRDFVCATDSDCVPSIVTGPPQVCSFDCGNHCVPK